MQKMISAADVRLPGPRGQRSRPSGLSEVGPRIPSIDLFRVKADTGDRMPFDLRVRVTESRGIIAFRKRTSDPQC
jgi:hypothetical protein